VAKSWPFKDPSETLDYSFDWGPRGVTRGDPIVSASATVEEGSVEVVEEGSGPAQDDPRKTVVWLTGGTDGETCTILLTAETQTGRIMTDRVDIKIALRGTDDDRVF
jgi:hypothetical protein